MRVSALLLTAIVFSSPSLSRAETLAFPEATAQTEVELDATQLEPAVTTPKKGASMQEVRRRFGSPVKTYKAVGGSSKRQPPITRWDYEQFYVFFEHAHVVRAVIPGRPPKIQNEERLQPMSPQ